MSYDSKNLWAYIDPTSREKTRVPVVLDVVQRARHRIWSDFSHFLIQRKSAQLPSSLQTAVTGLPLRNLNCQWSGGWLSDVWCELSKEKKSPHTNDPQPWVWEKEVDENMYNKDSLKCHQTTNLNRASQSFLWWYLSPKKRVLTLKSELWSLSEFGYLVVCDLKILSHMTTYLGVHIIQVVDQVNICKNWTV